MEKGEIYMCLMIELSRSHLFESVCQVDNLLKWTKAKASHAVSVAHR